ncbi:hypothetical protein KY289_018840 [Solanum tuberosum]|nr:hypothetical protein KY289_018840 [Solanum tuberosum]
MNPQQTTKHPANTTEFYNKNAKQREIYQNMPTSGKKTLLLQRRLNKREATTKRILGNTNSSNPAEPICLSQDNVDVGCSSSILKSVTERSTLSSSVVVDQGKKMTYPFYAFEKGSTSGTTNDSHIEIFEAVRTSGHVTLLTMQEVDVLEIKMSIKALGTGFTEFTQPVFQSSTMCNPPKKQKRTTVSGQDPSHGGSGRETSQIWNHFEKFLDKKGEQKGKCNYCSKVLSCPSKYGTSNLWTHINSNCAKSPYRIIDISQPTLKLKPIKEGGQGTLEKIVYNVVEVKKAVAEFVILDEQPFKVVEGEGFKRLMTLILPNYELPSRITVARQCLQIYQEEKNKLKRLIKDQRVCLTSDTWTSIQNLTYMVITAHWINDEWNLQKKILNFFHIPDHKGETIAKGIEACLLDWGIENLFTMTLDNATANSAAITHLKARINYWKGIILENNFLHVRCNAHILNLIVKEGLNEQNESISRVRLVVKYVKSSASRTDSFRSYVEKVKLDTRGLLSLDVETRSGDPLLSNMAKHMEKKFTKYWGDFDDMNMLLFVAIVLDPRYKFKYVEFLFKIFYKPVEGVDRSTKVNNTLSLLYTHYANSLVETHAENIKFLASEMSQNNKMQDCDVQSQWEKFVENENNVDTKSDLDKYLLDDLEKSKNFNILAWWKSSSERYPIVSKIARDVLVIPVSTVASESAFSTGGRILDCYRSSLSPKTAEALICSQQWLRTATFKEYKFEDLLDEIQNLEILEKEHPGTPLRID